MTTGSGAARSTWAPLDLTDLYAAGGAGTVWGPFTHSGGGLTDALVFGRLAGQNAIRFRR